MASEYDNGDLVRVTGTFTNAAGAAVDPTAVLFKVKAPNGQTTTYTYGTDAALVKESTGVYYVDVNANQSGKWRVRWYSTGTGQAATEDFFTVRDSDFD